MDSSIGFLTIDVIRSITRSITGYDIADIYKILNKSDSLTNENIEKAYKSLKDTSLLIDVLQQDLTNKVKIVEKLKADYSHYSKLAELEKEKAKPFLNELGKTLDRNKYKDRLVAITISIMTGLLIFVLGIWLGPQLTKLFIA